MGWFGEQLGLKQPFLNWLAFWTLFLVLVFAIRWLIKRVASFLKWDSLMWLTQWTGLALGAVRGLWWTGICLLILVSSGWSYLQESIEQRSLGGPKVIELWRQGITRVTEHLPLPSGVDTTFPPAVVTEGQNT